MNKGIMNYTMLDYKHFQTFTKVFLVHWCTKWEDEGNTTHPDIWVHSGHSCSAPQRNKIVLLK